MSLANQLRFGGAASFAAVAWASFGRLGLGRLAPGRLTLGSRRAAPDAKGVAAGGIGCDRGSAGLIGGSLNSGRGRKVDPRKLGEGLLVAGLLPASLLSAGLPPTLSLAPVVVRPDAGADDDGAGDEGDDAEGDNSEEGADGGRGDDGDDDGVRGHTGPFPLPLGGVPLEFNAVSPLWRHHQLPAPKPRCWQ